MARSPLRLARSSWWSLLAVVGGALALLASPDGWAWIFCGVLVVLGIARQVLRLLAAVRRGMLARFRVRFGDAVLLALALGCWAWAGHPERSDAVVLAIGVLLALLWLTRNEPVIAPAPLRASHLPGAPEGTPGPARWPLGWAGASLCGLLVLGLAAAELRLSVLLLLMVAVLGGAMAAVSLANGRLHAHNRHNRRIRRALRDLAPVFALPYNGHAQFHLQMWVPYLARTGERLFVVTTDPDSFRRVTAWGALPVVFAPHGKGATVQALFPRSVRAAFYVYYGRNREFLSVRGISHVWLHHGDSDKAGSTRPGVAKFDVLVVAGQAAIDRYAARKVAIPPGKFKILGRPQTEGIRTADRPISAVSDPVVLYAPTLYGPIEAKDYSSLLSGRQIVAALLARGATVIFRPHPAGRNYPPHRDAIQDINAALAADAQRTGRQHRFGAAADTPTFADVANSADALVSDVSSVVIDFMQSLKPYAMVSTRLSIDEFRRQFPSSESAYVIEGDLTNLGEVLDAMLGTDPLAQSRIEARRYYLGGFGDGESARAFVDYAASLARSPQVDPPATPRGPAVTAKMHSQTIS